MSEFPLQNVNESQLRQLSRILWSWTVCSDCENGQPCGPSDCSSHRTKRLIRFYEQYKQLTASYEANIGSGQQACLHSHEDLFRIIQALKDNPDVTRAQLGEILFGARPESLSLVDQ